MKYMTWKEHKAELMKDPEFVKAWKETELEYQIARAIIEARIKKGITQKILAEKLQTKQSVISRLESGKTTPSLSLLKRLAEALNVPLKVQFGT